jgi:type I site-specific restriction-modification system R (restriction) subunit
MLDVIVSKIPGFAVEAIVECINDNRGNGYIWHTTGSGKTLTSFKASTLLKENELQYLVSMYIQCLGAIFQNIT